MENNQAPGYKDLNKEIIQWALQCLSSLGYTLKSNHPQPVQKTPWSYVVRFESTQGDLYLKHTPKLLALEAPIIKRLQAQFQASVPVIIAHHTNFNVFIMQDAGQSLREVLKQQFDVSLYCKAITQFLDLQHAIAHQTEVLLDIGVPDWRLEKFPNLYQQLLTHKKQHLHADGLDASEIDALSKRLPKLEHLLSQLQQYQIKTSMVQPDFHDNNMLFSKDSQKISFIDLGEVVISHPFFQIQNLLDQAQKHHQLHRNNARYQKILDTLLAPYRKTHTKQELMNALAIINKLAPLYQAFSTIRLLEACDKNSVTRFYGQGKISAYLRDFITACS